MGWLLAPTNNTSKLEYTSQSFEIYADLSNQHFKWDRDQPQPALVDALRDKPHILGSPFKDVDGKKTRKIVLVPGCGRGYDVLLFSSYGFNAVGLDISPKAVEEARKVQADQGKEQQYPVKNIQDGRGEARFITADFFMGACTDR